jgi:hypothetical protein
MPTTITSSSSKQKQKQEQLLFKNALNEFKRTNYNSTTLQTIRLFLNSPYCKEECKNECFNVFLYFLQHDKLEEAFMVLGLFKNIKYSLSLSQMKKLEGLLNGLAEYGKYKELYYLTQALPIEKKEMVIRIPMEDLAALLRNYFDNLDNAVKQQQR